MSSFSKRDFCAAPNCIPGSGPEVFFREVLRAGLCWISLPVAAAKEGIAVPEGLRLTMLETVVFAEGEEAEKIILTAMEQCVLRNVFLLNLAFHPDMGEAGKRETGKVLKKCAVRAAEKGIRLALETFGGMTSCAKECLAALERIGEANVGITFDTGNVLRFHPEISGRDLISEELPLLKGNLFAVHLKDTVRSPGKLKIVPPGKGEIDFRELFRELERMEFKGSTALDLETSDASSPEEHGRILSESAEYLVRCSR